MITAPSTPVYWQLESVSLEPTVTPSGGYTVAYEMSGFGLDLEDPLMAQSLVENDPAYTPSLTLTIVRNEHAMQHTYTWTPVPVYLEPGVEYTIDITGDSDVSGGTLNTLFYTYTQGAMNTRTSADGYSGNPAGSSFVISPSATSLYKDGSLVVSFILRDVNDMFRLRVAYTFAMNGGFKPVPTPVPGFVAAELPGGALPSFYDLVEGHEALWAVTTAKDEFRAYGVMSGSPPAFFPADQEGNVVMDEKPADPKKDYDAFVKGYVPFLPADADVPGHYQPAGPGEYAFITRDGEAVTRKYGRVNGGPPAFFAVDEEGGVAEDSAPVDPAVDYSAYIEGFGAANPPETFSHYKVAGDHLYAFEARDGEPHYRVFGRLDGAEPAYYEATPEGEPVAGAAPIVPERDFEEYIKGFTPTDPQDPPAFYERLGTGFFAVTDRQGEKVYRAYGVKDGQAPAFYGADEEGGVAEDAARVPVSDDFEQYIAGFDPIATDLADVPLYYHPTDSPDVWMFTDVSGSTHYRAFGVLNRGQEAFYYPCDEDGNVAVDALPVRPAADLAIMPPPKFAEVLPVAIPDFYIAAREGGSLFAFADREGESVYRAYGAYGRAMPQFYPADAEGVPFEDAAPVDPAEDFDAYIKGFEPMTPREVPSHYKLADESKGLYSFDTRANETLYRAYGVVDRATTGFFQADAQGTLLSEEPIQQEDEIPLMPTPVAYTVVTQSPDLGPGTTPLSRTYPAGPEPTTYTSGVLSTETPAGETPSISREVVPFPDPTPYSSEVLTSATPEGGEPTPIVVTLQPDEDPAVLISSVLPSEGDAPTTEPVNRQLPEITKTPEEQPVVTEPTIVVIEPTVATEPTAAAEAITTPPATPAATEEPTAEVPVGAETEVPDTNGIPDPDPSGLSAGWIAVIAAAAVAVAGGGYAMLRKKKK